MTTLLLSLVGCQCLFADDILVPEEYSSIQSAIEIANDGDHILVSPGVYDESITIVGKAITITGVKGADATTINGNSANSVIVVQDCDSITIDGFTIRDGNAITGGGVNSSNSVARLQNCIITNNSSNNNGAGVFADGGTFLLYNCNVKNNVAGGAGGGLYFRDLINSSVIGAEVSNNSAVNGGGAYIKDMLSQFIFSSSEVSNNACVNNGGGLYVKNSMMTMVDNAIINNESNKGGGLFTYAGGNVSFENGSLQGNSALDAGGGAEIRSSVCSFSNTTFDSNNADSDCDGVGSGGAIDVVNSSVTVTDIVLCANMTCGAIDDFSGDNVVVEGETEGCDVGSGACCGGSACWIMEEDECLNGGGIFLGGGSVCLVDSCVASVELGSCCISPVCVMTTEAECDDAGGEYGGELVACSEVICESTCVADLNQDGSVNVDDLILVISYWGACP
ncbi:MAG: hypothetical protein MK073_01840 [Phycisphaerales bacterium]|nr:hypothetical protein [Phycisphaerales bacterium]